MNSGDRLKILERAVESARNGIVITDPNLPDNPIVYTNKAFQEMSGYQLDEVLGRNCRFLQGADLNQEGLVEVRRAVNTAGSCLTLLRNYKKNGSLFWNELSISPVHDDDGKLIFFIGIQNDVSARKDAERRVSEFYSMISHELRTPVSSIRASLGLIADGEAGETSPQTDRLVLIAMRNAQRLLKLVDEVLDLKKLESGKLELELDMLHPEEVIAEVIAALSQLAAESGVTLAVDIKKKKSICADPIRVAQILTNLIGNAIKFSPSSSQITVTVDQVDRIMYFSVNDQGPGIAAEDLDKLFVKFQQLDSSDTRMYGGTGLGLAICKLIVELHGGKIGVDSQPGAGSTFWFTLPMVPQESPSRD